MKKDEKEIQSEDRTICVVCAWRENCQKKFTFSSSGSARCPDYTRDMTIPREK